MVFQRCVHCRGVAQFYCWACREFVCDGVGCATIGRRHSRVTEVSVIDDQARPLSALEPFISERRRSA